MVKTRNKLAKLPGWIGVGIITLLNTVWLYWGMGELFYEGWGVPGNYWFLYLSIAAAAIAFSLVAIRWPYVGGGILVAAGVAFAIWWLVPTIQSGVYSFGAALERLFLSGGFTLVGVMFILDARFNPRQPEDNRAWWKKHLRTLLAVGIPLLTGLVVAAYNLPTVLTRVDDGDRSARLIKGNGIELIWAPEGPGWNWKQDFGGYPSWRALATYGLEVQGLGTEIIASEADMAETGICAYLTEDGAALADEPLYIWRMPTADEIARSLSRHGVNAGCTWNGEIGRMDCTLTPDKETPLWAPDESPVYYWTADAFDDDDAYYVSYTGFVSHQPKTWGNPRHGYRCVREP